VTDYCINGIAAPLIEDFSNLLGGVCSKLDLNELQSVLAARSSEILALVPSLFGSGIVNANTINLNGNLLGKLTSSLQPTPEF
jgi:hypothetical protein